MRTVALERRESRTSPADWYLVSVTERLVGSLDEESWDPDQSLLVSFSTWKTNQEALLLARRDCWLRGDSGSAVLTPGAPNGDWSVSRW